MDLKHKEVEQWLESIYGPENIPEFEKNEATITLLHSMFANVSKAEKRFHICEEDFLARAQEYVAQGEQLASVMQGIGVRKTGLSSDAQAALKNIADAACAVEARTPSESDIILGYNRLEAEHDRLSRKSDSNLHLRSQLVACSQQLASKLQHVNSLTKQAAATTAIEEKERLSNDKRTLFHEKKLAEYQGEICSREASLKHRGYSESVSHEAVMERYQQLQKLHKEVSSMQSQLETYSLPPDMVAARLAVEEAKQKLDDIMSDMARVQSHA